MTNSFKSKIQRELASLSRYTAHLFYWKFLMLWRIRAAMGGGVRSISYKGCENHCPFRVRIADRMAETAASKVIGLSM